MLIGLNLRSLPCGINLTIPNQLRNIKLLGVDSERAGGMSNVLRKVPHPCYQTGS